MDNKIANFELRQFLQLDAALPSECVDVLVYEFRTKLYAQGEFLARQDEQFDDECLLLSGQALLSIFDPEGNEICVGLCDGSAALPPHISRTNTDRSLVNIQVTKPGIIAHIKAVQLMNMMVENPAIRQWGNAIMRAELQRRAEHQWALAALDNKQKLAWFRQKYDRYEDKFDHWRIASFLGMTPVSFSRARGLLKP